MELVKKQTTRTSCSTRHKEEENKEAESERNEVKSLNNLSEMNIKMYSKDL